MGREDVYENDYLEDPEIFADLVNGVLYEGKQQSNADERINPGCHRQFPGNRIIAGFQYMLSNIRMIHYVGCPYV